MDSHATPDGDVLNTAYDSVVTTSDAAVLLAETAAEGARATQTALRQQIHDHPYVTLGVAAGVGFLVAGGLSAPAVWGLARVGARCALAHLSRELTAAIVARDDPRRSPQASPSPSPDTQPVDSSVAVA